MKVVSTAVACPASGQMSGRNFLVDSGASFNLIGLNNITDKEKSTLRDADPIRLGTANGYVYSSKVVDVYVPDLNGTFEFYCPPSCQPVLSMGQLANLEYDFNWTKVDGLRTMRIWLNPEEFVECRLINDVPRLFVASKEDSEADTSLVLLDSAPDDNP